MARDMTENKERYTQAVTSLCEEYAAALAEAQLFQKLYDKAIEELKKLGCDQCDKKRCDGCTSDTGWHNWRWKALTEV